MGLSIKEFPEKFKEIVGVVKIEKDKNKYYVYHYISAIPADIGTGYETGSQFSAEDLHLKPGDVCRFLYGQAKKTKDGNIYQSIEEVQFFPLDSGKK